MSILAHLIVLLLINFVLGGADYYKILGVARNADAKTIKRAFKKLSLKYHPDKNRQNPEAAKAKFVEVANAYEVLIDPEKKKIYDQFGEEGLKQGGPGGHHGQGFENFNFDDVFSSFFGGRGGGGGGGGGHFQFNMGGQRFQQQQQQQQEEENFWDKSDVIGLDMGSLSKFYRRTEVWLILFYNPRSDSNFQKIKDVWRELAEKMYGILKVAAVNCNNDQEVCEEYEIYETPKVKVYSANIKSEGFIYQGSFEYQQLASFGVAQMESFVQLVTKSNINEFFAQEQEKYHVILFTAKKSTPPLMKAISKDFKQYLVFGEIRQSENELIQKFNIQQFPTIAIVTDSENNEIIKYEGSTTNKDQIAKFMREYAYQKKQQHRGTGKLEDLNPNKLEKGHCGPKDQNFCCLFVYDDIKQLQSNQALLQRVAGYFLDDPIRFYTVNKNSINANDIFHSDVTIPQLVILRTKRNRLTKYEGAYEVEAIKSFIENVISGAPLTGKLKVNIKFNNYKQEL